MNDPIKRCPENPLLDPASFAPSRPELKIEGVFNSAAVQDGKDTLLLARVAETASDRGSSTLKIPVLSPESTYQELAFEEIATDNPAYSFHDSRSVRRNENNTIHRLTSISHLKLLRSRDGIHFQLDPKAALYPLGVYEQWGIEDPRITKIDDRYYITYSAISPMGVCVALASTDDFYSYKRHGCILPPTNKDVVIFPRKVGGRYLMLHRPVPSEIGGLNIWLSESDNLLDWGSHRCLYSSGSAEWEEERVGAGPPPILCEKGWLVIYHGTDRKGAYYAGALLLDREQPENIIAKTDEPILSPDSEYEKQGFYPNVVFPCGSIETETGLQLYYGAADDKVCMATISWKRLWEVLNV